MLKMVRKQICGRCVDMHVNDMNNYYRDIQHPFHHFTLAFVEVES